MELISFMLTRGWLVVYDDPNTIKSTRGGWICEDVALKLHNSEYVLNLLGLWNQVKEVIKIDL
jgi:hypothetical protein